VQLRRAGIDPARVELLERTDTIPQHLQLYARVDVALDTFPYNGTTTTCEALWMGCPVVALRGDRHAARVSASLVSAAGHPEWIGRTQEEYVAIAGGLVRDLAVLAAQRDRLRAEMKASLLLNYPLQAQRFGAAIRTAWGDGCRLAKTSTESAFG
jgi:predicted O-linked N-acetylglucosamine transferase (SPINDLY family)